MRLALAFGLVVTAAAAFGGVYAFKYAATATGSGGTAMTSAAAPAMSPVAPSGSVVASVVTTTTGQSPPPAPAPARAVIPSAAAVAAPAPPTLKTPVPVCNNPNALGVSRVVEIDTTGGPGFGFEHFKNYDFLKEGEVVFTFDDGPWLNNTPMVLKALADQCVRATFFPIGKHATYYPDITHSTSPCASRNRSSKR